MTTFEPIYCVLACVPALALCLTILGICILSGRISETDEYRDRHS